MLAAKACGFETGGWAPLGWETEAGIAPWLGTEFGLRECETPGYPARNEMNARECDALFWFGRRDTRGYASTMKVIEHRGKPIVWVQEGVSTPRMAFGFLTEAGARVEVLWVAGNRESINPGIGDRVEKFLRAVLRIAAEHQGRRLDHF